jgi:hypothetical protein
MSFTERDIKGKDVYLNSILVCFSGPAFKISLPVLHIQSDTGGDLIVV